MFSRSSSNPPFPDTIPGFFRVGWVQSAHGIRGELFIRLMAGRADWRAERLHLLTPGAEAPRSFEVESARPHKDGLLVRLKGLSTRTEAEALRKAAVYVADEVLRSPPGEPIFLRQILGFELVDPAGAGLGEISGFSSNGPQDLLEVSRPGRPVALVPFVDAFLIDIDFDKKQVRMDLPPGLLNLEEE